MEKPTKRESIKLLVAALVVLFAYICRFKSIPIIGGNGLLRSVIYTFLFMFWGISLYLRLIHPQVRRFTISIDVMMIFWIVVHQIKFSLPDNLPVLERYLWYIYYLPMLGIPFLALMVALSIGLPESEKLPQKAFLFGVPTIVLFLLVITNDLHQLVFRFPENAVIWNDNEYTHGIGYILLAAYILINAVLLLGMLILKCRLGKKKRWMLLPCLPIILLLIYSVLYCLNSRFIKMWCGDLTLVFCVLYAACYELCIRCGLIRTNTSYVELFQTGSIGAQIVNRKHEVCLLNQDALELSEQQMLDTERQPILLNRSILLNSKAIRFGHVFWQEDVSELVDAIEESEENYLDLAERNRIHQENLDAEQEILALQEKNRVNDMLHKETFRQIEYIDELLSRYQQEPDSEEARKLLAGAAVVGAYIKRYGNLLLVSEQNDTKDIRDLIRCFEESFLNLELLSIDCLCTLSIDSSLFIKDILHIYQTFETILEDCMFDLRHVWVHGRERNGVITLQMEFVSETDLSPYAVQADGYSYEAETSRFTFHMQKGGALWCQL